MWNQVGPFVRQFNCADPSVIARHALKIADLLECWLQYLVPIISDVVGDDWKVLLSVEEVCEDPALSIRELSGSPLLEGIQTHSVGLERVLSNVTLWEKVPCVHIVAHVQPILVQ